MNENYYQLDSGKYFKAIYRQKWLVILCLGISLLLAWQTGGNTPPYYQASISFWIRGMKGEQGVLSEKIMRLFYIGQESPFGTDYDTQIEIMKSSLILEKVVESLGLPSKTKRSLNDSVKLVRSSVSISKAITPSIIEIKAIHSSPEMAINMANAVCQAYIEFNRDLSLEQEQRKLKSMEDQARLIREQMGKNNDLITERIKGDMYLLLMEKIAETRLNLSLSQSEWVKILDKAEEATLVPTKRILKVFLMGVMGLFLGTVLAVAIDTLIGNKKKKVV